MIIAVTRPRARRPIVVNVIQILPVQALGARLLEGGVALALPLHRAQLARLPIVGQVSGRAVRVPIGISLASGRVIVAAPRVRVIVRRILLARRVLLLVVVVVVVVRMRMMRMRMMIIVPQRGGGDGHVDSFRLPVRVPVPVPTHRDTVVVESALGQRVHVLIREIAGGRVRVQALLVVHYPVHGILPARLPHRAPPARPPRPVARDHGPPLHSSRRHRLWGHAVVVDRRFRLRVLDAVQRPRLLLLPFSLGCVRDKKRRPS